ncbi:MAG TPA: 30S ribosomal protein S6 [Candidatus Omnitrophica bacterium]|nr:30S ribosomal protein S6 [Candidatus Omnitrophota bacterium]
MNSYELTLICKPDLKEEKQKKVIEGLKKIIGGTKVKVDLWGKRPLAYDIKKKKEGVYYLLSFEAKPEILPTLEKELRLEEDVIRYLIVRL